MKRTLFLMMIIGFCTSALAADDVIRRPITAIDSNEDTHYYAYNSKNQLESERFGTTFRLFSYDREGVIIGMDQYAWVDAVGTFVLNMRESYEYDEDGNLAKKIVDKSIDNPYGAVWTYVYYDYDENGTAKYYDEYKGSSLWYMFKQVPTYDDKQRLVRINTYRDDPEDYESPTHETMKWEDEYTKYYCAFEYDENGVVTKETKNSVEYTYTYADLCSDYLPKNVVASVDGCNVHLTWDAVEGATGYVVSYNLERVNVDATEYTATVGVGVRQFYVQAIIDGVERNVSRLVKVLIKDPGVKPVTDLAVGTVFETEEETESDAQRTRKFYNIPLTWKIPEGHSTISKFLVYYNSRAYGDNTYVSVMDTAATSFVLKVDPYEVMEWNEDGDLAKGLDVPIYVTVKYESGESEPSNVVVVNPYRALGYEPATKEDVNGDGSVDTQDVLAIYDSIQDATNESAFDVNGDGSVDTQDVLCVYDYMQNN